MSASRLKEALESCSNLFVTGDPTKSDEAVAGVAGIVESIVESPPPDAEDVLDEIYRFLSCPASNQMAVDVLSLDLSKVVIRLASLSDKCEESAGNIVKHLVGICSPRDMLAVLCEALDIHINVSKAPMFHVLLLNELSKVLASGWLATELTWGNTLLSILIGFLKDHCMFSCILCMKQMLNLSRFHLECPTVFNRIQRRHIEQIKVALPVILKVINAVSLEADEEYENSLDDLFRAAISIGTSIQIICKELEGRGKQELCAILGLYSLHNIALISRSRQKHIIRSYGPRIVDFSHFLKFTGLSYCGLVIGCDFNSIAREISEVDDDDFKGCFSFAMDGAALAVIWGHILDEAVDAAGQQLDASLNEIRDDYSKRWQAVGAFKSILSCNDYPWEIKSHSIELLSSIVDGVKPEESNDQYVDFSSYVPSVFAVLRGIERTLICAPDASIRKKAFGALKKLVSNLPCNERFDILKALITNSGSPSMMAILIDIVKEEIHIASRQRNLTGADETSKQDNYETSPFWSPDVLDVVELVLKPSKGGPPPLPEHCEPVLSALNLYRFILILESRGKTNQTGVVSENTLHKAYTEWLLPLRALTMGIQAENDEDRDAFADDILCALAPVQLVLHRCIELVEEERQHSA